MTPCGPCEILGPDESLPCRPSASTNTAVPRCCGTETAPDPEPGPGRAIVRVRACALNHLDLWQRQGLDRVRIPFPHISGADVAGEIAAVDDSVGRFRSGDRVMLQPGLSCGACPACLAGRDNVCPRYDVLGLQSPGGYAELVAVPVANLIGLPDYIDVVEAAAFPLTFLTAWHMLFARAGLRPGDVVLVVAAGSGVGQAAIQIARAFHARVIATAGTPAKLDRARDSGRKPRSIIMPTTSWRGSRASRADAAPTSSSTMSASRPGTAARDAWHAAGAW